MQQRFTEFVTRVRFPGSELIRLLNQQLDQNLLHRPEGLSGRTSRVWVHSSGSHPFLGSSFRRSREREEDQRRIRTGAGNLHPSSNAAAAKSTSAAFERPPRRRGSSTLASHSWLVLRSWRQSCWFALLLLNLHLLSKSVRI